MTEIGRATADLRGCRNDRKTDPVFRTDVRSILDGRKTQTRRVIHLPESAKVDRKKGTYSWAECGYSGQDVTLPKCPYGVPGDRLWVRETFYRPYNYQYGKIFYQADGETVGKGLKWRASIHMPRRASRITLEVTGVRVERLQEISEDDARAEGMLSRGGWNADETKYGINYTGPFSIVWDSINAKRPGCSWEDNPWVFVVEFKRV